MEPRSKGLLTGRYRKGQPMPDSLRARRMPRQMSDERSLDAVEALLPLAAEAGLSLTHLALAFVMAHPVVTAAIIGPRTMEHLDDLLAGMQVRLSDALLDRIDEIAPPGYDVGLNEANYHAGGRRRCGPAPPGNVRARRGLSKRKAGRGV